MTLFPRSWRFCLGILCENRSSRRLFKVSPSESMKDPRLTDPDEITPRFLLPSFARTISRAAAVVPQGHVAATIRCRFLNKGGKCARGKRNLPAWRLRSADCIIFCNIITRGLKRFKHKFVYYSLCLAVFILLILPLKFIIQYKIYYTYWIITREMF